MGEYMFGVTTEEPSRALATQWDAICREEGGDGYVECNRSDNGSADPGLNRGQYQGWFVAEDGDCKGELAQRVLARVEREAPVPVPAWHVQVQCFVSLSAQQRQAMTATYAAVLTRAYGSREAVCKAWEAMSERKRRYGTLVQQWPSWVRSEEVAEGARWEKAAADAHREAIKDWPAWHTPQTFAFSIDKIPQRHGA